ncbi:hypothetical protein GW17_00006691 [Ensete ventricosum]|nr:hypothetical protein GW17_00006691 [Ensete ventricosum]
MDNHEHYVEHLFIFLSVTTGRRGVVSSHTGKEASPRPVSSLRGETLVSTVPTGSGRYAYRYPVGSVRIAHTGRKREEKEEEKKKKERRRNNIVPSSPARRRRPPVARARGHFFSHVRRQNVSPCRKKDRGDKKREKLVLPRAALPWFPHAICRPLVIHCQRVIPYPCAGRRNETTLEEFRCRDPSCGYR